MTWLAELFTDLYKVLQSGHPFPLIKPVVVFTDNAGAISLEMATSYTARVRLS